VGTAGHCSGSPLIAASIFADSARDRQTCLRELLLVADHTAYHVAQTVDIRRARTLVVPARSRTTPS
jgi:hypothetical protein